MHYNCPFCSTLYDIDPADLGADGNDFQCVNCNSVFHVSPADGSISSVKSDLPHQTSIDQSGSQWNEQSPTIDLGQSGQNRNADQHYSEQPDISTFPMKDPDPPQIDFTLPKTSPAPTELPTGFFGQDAPKTPAPPAQFSPPTSHLEFPSGTIPPPPTATPPDFNPYSGGLYDQPYQKNSVYTSDLAKPHDQSIRIVREPTKQDDINRTNLWNVRIGEKIERGLQLIQLKSWIRTGTLRETDEVQEPGGGWIQAVESTELDRFFRLKAKIDAEKIAATSSKHQDEIYCLNHTNDIADWVCVGCDRPWCKDCVEERIYGGAKVIMCPKCGDRCLPIERKGKVTPFWHQIPDIFQYPLRKHGPIMIVLGTLLIYLSQIIAVMTLGFGLIIAIALLGLVFAYLLRIVYKSSRLEDKGLMPDFPDVTNNFSREMILPFFQVLMAYILYFIVPILISYWFIAKYNTYFIEIVNRRPVVHLNRASVVVAIFSLIGLYLFPMVVSIIAVHKTVVPAFNPILIIRLIKRVPGPYTLMLIFQVVIIIGYSFALYLIQYLLFKIGFAPFFISILSGFISFYIFSVISRLLGLFIKQVEDDLGWTS